ncbi:hypothetical protein ACFO1B_18810 [Dactylosporangium siamense]|uniref:DUF4034 domain-containing protein n=1 Tax=Dactylosporangium siamense TaxID=685454 RepID=A0A919U9N4_9ACTN|nr:hypothetical protein [Dactylosporangium siamense]GIG43930.1 hypothetical protein Dsi01nite_019710 [Dactylosporangium siamense]
MDTLTARTGASVPAGLDDWVRAEPGNPTALAVRGGVEVIRAWEIRGGFVARQTQEQRLRDFITVLGQAEGYCRAAAQADPRDPAPWAYLLQMARGQQVGTDEVLRRRDELEARAPQHFTSQLHAAIALGPMWGGSADLAVDHIRKWLTSAPADSTLPALFFVVQFQRFLREGRGFARDAEVRADGHRAAEQLPARPCATPDEFLAHNYAAAWFSLTREPGAANGHFKLLGGNATEYPWTFLGDRPLATFRGKRQSALLRLPF